MEGGFALKIAGPSAQSRPRLERAGGHRWSGRRALRYTPREAAEDHGRLAFGLVDGKHELLIVPARGVLPIAPKISKRDSTSDSPPPTSKARPTPIASSMQITCKAWSRITPASSRPPKCRSFGVSTNTR